MCHAYIGIYNCFCFYMLLIVILFLYETFVFSLAYMDSIVAYMDSIVYLLVWLVAGMFFCLSICSPVWLLISLFVLFFI